MVGSHTYTTSLAWPRRLFLIVLLPFPPNHVQRGQRRRAARVEPVRRDPQLPVDTRVAYVADRRGHRLHRVRPRLRPPRPRPSLSLLAAAGAARARARGSGAAGSLPSGLLRREGRGRGVPRGVRGTGGGTARRRRAVAAGGAGELPAGQARGRGQGEVYAGHRVSAAAQAAAPGPAAEQEVTSSYSTSSYHSCHLLM